MNLAWAHHRWTTAIQRRILFLLAGNLLLLIGIGFLLKEGASFTDVVNRIGPDLAPILIAGLALTGIIAVGGIDLSIGSIIAVSGTVLGILVHHQVPPFLSFALTVATGWLLMAGNGFLVRQLAVPAIIVTLAGLPLYRGLALILADIGIPNFGGNISVHAEAYHLPGKSYPGWILGITLAAALTWEWFGKKPRQWLALGSSDEACRLIGLSPGRLLQSAFLWGGLFMGVAALLYVTRIQAIEPARMALGFELQVIGAVVLGGTNIFGGEGSYAGTALGALFLYLTSQLLTYANANPYFQEAITGAVIIAVIAVDCRLHRKQKLMEELA